jgi:hypothetical protein
MIDGVGGFPRFSLQTDADDVRNLIAAVAALRLFSFWAYLLLR